MPWNPSNMITDISKDVYKSNLISRDLSWLQFNHRVLDQARKKERNLFEKLKFLAISSSNADEFFMIRIGNLYNYVDYGRIRNDYSGLEVGNFKEILLNGLKNFDKQQNQLFLELKKIFKDHSFQIRSHADLSSKDKELTTKYFEKTIFPMLTPMVYDSYHSFPILMNNILIFGVITKSEGERKKMSFIQLPQNLQRFYEIEHKQETIFVPIETIVREHFDHIFKHVNILTHSLFRITRNGDFSLEELEDEEADFLEEMKRKLRIRETGRVVRLEIEQNEDLWLLKSLKNRYNIDTKNIKTIQEGALIDYTCLWQIVNHEAFRKFKPQRPTPILPIRMVEEKSTNIDMFKILKKHDVLLHHPYNTLDPVLKLLEQAAEDTNVLSIKLTIYRLASHSQIVEALLKAAENGKHVSVLFEVKARFDEENNMKQALLLQKAGCFVIYGVGSSKVHTKLLLIVRKDKEKITRYVHMSSGNYNEVTSKLYTDISLLTSDEVYANDVQDFFNVITGHSILETYQSLITAPIHMRNKLIKLIDHEKSQAEKKQLSGIVIKLNSLQDKDTIQALYQASQKGVRIKLIVRGICCLRPQRKGISENITVKSIVGEYLEHSRIYYFHNNGDPQVYCGSADMMVRSFDSRLESLFIIKDPLLKKQVIKILDINLKDDANSYTLNEDGSYTQTKVNKNNPCDLHKEFYKIDNENMVKKTALF